jgi:hypothetical protein
MKITTTIKEFLAIARKEWMEHENSITHSDDSLPFSEWTSEWSREYRRQYGVYFDNNAGVWQYDMSNSNFKGHDICLSCGDNFDSDGPEICPECDAIELD